LGRVIRRHKPVLGATDFFTTEVWTPTGLTTFYVLLFLQLQTRTVILRGLKPFPARPTALLQVFVVPWQCPPHAASPAN